MGEILRDLPGVVCHVNDVLVSGKYQREHDNHLHDVLNKIQEAGIILKQGEMLAPELYFLAYHRCQ